MTVAHSDSANGVNGSRKPHLVFAASPAEGHTYPLLKIAGELVQRGYPATFIGGEQFEAQIKAIGIEHVTLKSMMTPEALAMHNAMPVGVPRLLYDMKQFFIAQTPVRWHALKGALEKIKAEDPSRDIVIVPESCFMGVNPLVLGAPLPEGFTTRPKVVNIQLAPYMARSVDTGPFGPGLPPDSSESGRMRNKLLEEMMVMGPFSETHKHQMAVLAELGATKAAELKLELPWHHWMALHDVTLQMCPPSLEYPRSDMLPNVRFAGCFKPKEIAADFVYPEWWADVTRGDKRVVTVAQGTVALEYNDLLVPSLEALGGRDDVLVVAILGERGASLPETAKIPANARVIDYLSYDAVLPHSSVFIMNAGYGGFLHGVTNGVPMVLAGESEDKKEVAMRGEWSGVGVNLRTSQPKPEAILEAVDRVLTEPSFKKRVLEIKRENEELSTLDLVERQILEFAQ